MSGIVTSKENLVQTTSPLLADRIETTSDAIILFVNKKKFALAWEDCSPRLKQATDEQRQHAELSPGGYGIHWPLIDEDLSVAGLLARANG